MPGTATDIITNTIVVIIIAVMLTPFFLAIKVGIGVMRDLYRDDEDNKYWRWGMFYYNKDDERLFVPHRDNGFPKIFRRQRMTLNFGNRYAKVLIALQLIFIAIIICVRYLHK